MRAIVPEFEPIVTMLPARRPAMCRATGRVGLRLEIMLVSITRRTASGEAGFVTGQVWTVDGGRMAKLSLP